jgi:hypothetical protein
MLVASVNSGSQQQQIVWQIAERSDLLLTDP